MNEDKTTQGYYRLLDIFSNGNLQDYLDDAKSLPTLTKAQKHKLQLLSLVSMAMYKRKIPIDDIVASLKLESSSEAENLAIEAVYSHLIEAKIDSKSRDLLIECSAGRDVILGPQNNNITIAYDALLGWKQTVSSVIDDIDQKISELQDICSRKLKTRSQKNNVAKESKSKPSTPSSPTLDESGRGTKRGLLL